MVTYCWLLVTAIICVCEAYTSKFHSRFAPFVHSSLIHYVTEGDPEKSTILFIPGFGVGTFHYNEQIKCLSSSYNVVCLDLLGQGKSWPKEANGDINSHERLCYSTDLWVEQIKYMINDVIKSPVHLVGNSLGGFLAAIVAKDLGSKAIHSLHLMNPTPFWGKILLHKNIQE